MGETKVTELRVRVLYEGRVFYCNLHCVGKLAIIGEQCSFALSIFGSDA